MAKLLFTVQTIIDEIRAQLDEQNVDSVGTDTDILPTLNRAQDYAFHILATRYPEPILDYFFMPLESHQPEYTIPDNVFEDRIQKIEIQVPATISNTFTPIPGTVVGATFREIQRVSYRDVSNFESASLTNVPYYYAIYGRKIRFIPTPTGVFPVRIWFLRDPEKLVLPQGQIKLPADPTTGNYVIVDSAGPSLTTESDQFGSYVNIVNGSTGEIRCTLQIQSITGNKITFRSTPLRSSVLGRQVIGSGDLPGTGVAQDDYLSPIDGTCVPYFSRPVSNFMIQFTVAEITRKLGGQADEENAIIDKFEKQVERVWTGREIQLRVKKRSQNWGVPTRRWYFE